MDTDVLSACDQARRIAQLCELLGFEFRGAHHLIGALDGALKSGVSIAAMIEDPTNRPYIWDLE